MLTTSPWTYSFWSGAGAAAAAASSSWERIRRIPTRIRYAAPTSLTVVKAAADDAIRAERPTVAAATWTRPPLLTPSAETRPARRPLSTLCVTTYVTAGPGTTASATAATEKSASVPKLGIGG